MRIYWDKKLYDGDEEFSDIVKEVLMDSDLNDIMKAQEEEGNLAEKALNVDDAPPAEEPISKLTQEFSDMGKGVLVDIKDLMKSQEEGHFVGEVLATSELTEHFSNVAEEVLLDSNPKDIQKGGWDLLGKHWTVMARLSSLLGLYNFHPNTNESIVT